MKTFIGENFLLNSKAARELYHGYLEININLIIG